MALTLVIPSPTLAAEPQHSNFDFTYAATVCGIDVAVHRSGVINVWPGDPLYEYTWSMTVTLTSGNGKSISDLETGKGTYDYTVNSDGTYTFVNRYIGVQEKLFVPHGAPISLVAGSLTVELTTDDPNGGLSDLTTISHGHFPEVAGDPGYLCQVVTAALT